MEIFFPFFPPFPADKGTVTRRVSPISRGTATYYRLHFVPETIVLSLFTISPIPSRRRELLPGILRVLRDVDREMYRVPRARQETRRT